MTGFFGRLRLAYDLLRGYSVAYRINILDGQIFLAHNGHIRECNFEISEEFRNMFVARDLSRQINAPPPSSVEDRLTELEFQVKRLDEQKQDT